jgi:hypothetical protein
MGSIRSAQSCAQDEQTAVEEFYQQVQQAQMALVLFFCSSSYDLDAISAALQVRFAGVTVIGCTALGTYGPLGYHTHSLSGVSFSADICVLELGVFDELQSFDPHAAQQQVQQMRQSLEAQAPWVQSVNTFGWQLIDGLSVKEEIVTRALQNALGAVFMVGGSAADDMAFVQTKVYCNGAFRSERAVLALIATRLPFHLFMTQHFIPLDERMVVTRAQTSQRIVNEINGLPAAGEYARCAAVALEQLGPALFSRMPVVVKVGDHHYVRSIQQQLPDGSLRFYCAIEQGMVLRLAQGGDLVAGLQAMFSTIQDMVGPPQLVLGCECTLRRMEIEQQHWSAQVDQLCRTQKMVGFSTFGEQYRGVHLNQTLSGIAFGLATGADDDDRR